MTSEMSTNNKPSIQYNLQKLKQNNHSDGTPKITFSPESLSIWLSQQDIAKSTLDVLRCHEIDGLTFLMLTDNDLREMNLLKIGTRKKLLCLSNVWKKYVFEDPSDHNLNGSLSMTNTHCRIDMFSLLGQGMDNKSPLSPTCSSIHVDADCGGVLRERVRKMSFSSAPATNVPLGCVVDFGNLALKLTASAVYAFFVLCLTSFVMVLAHERLPDMSKYPPLPDLLLDNLPYIPWAFKAAEMVCLILLTLWVIILIFHRYRFILLRRYFSLMGTVFLLRSVTMIITSLSVPGQHLLESCKPQYYSTLQEKVNRALEISFGFGMSLQGVITCGDYMFSGHTACLTMLNFFITEYTPRNLHMLHTFTWVLNIFGVFFILAGHEHYSIDVFIACYISSRLFLYYHCLANNNSLMCRDKGRTRIWFPLFSFFESDVHGVVPNQFEVPFIDFVSRMWSQIFRTFVSNTEPTEQQIKHMKTSTPQAQFVNGRSSKHR